LDQPIFSVVLPAHNEAESIERVLREVAAAMPADIPHEILCIDDGSKDDTARRVAALRSDIPVLRLLRHSLCAGQSRAVATGVFYARGEWIATMDADGQNNPANILRMLEIARAAPGPVLVAGHRIGRQDTLSKQMASRAANAIRRAVLRDGCPDTGCGLKVFPRQTFMQLPVFNGLHRYLPALMGTLGLPLIMVPIEDRARFGGYSKYSNLGRALLGILDLGGVSWLRRRLRDTGKVFEP
jgi:dolichol-phosphate mannosyltransferase